MSIANDPRLEASCPLTNEQLLALCDVAEDDAAEAAPSVAALHAAARKVRTLTWTSDDSEPLAQVTALVASALGRLRRWTPKGYHPLREEHRGSVKAEDVRAVVVQLLGLVHPQKRADSVAFRAEMAIEEAVTFGYLVRLAYDAWHPGMASGAGHCTLVKATPLGVAKAGAELRPIVRPSPAPVRAAGAPTGPWKGAAKPVAPPAVNINNWQEGADAIATALQAKTKANGEERGVAAEPAYTVAALREMTGLENTALNRYAKLAGVRTPQRGERNYRYTAADVRAILEAILANASEDQLRTRCKAALQGLPEITAKDIILVNWSG